MRLHKGDVFQVYPNATIWILSSFVQSRPFFAFLCMFYFFYTNVVVSRYCDIHANSMTTQSVLKVPKFA